MRTISIGKKAKKYAAAHLGIMDYFGLKRKVISGFYLYRVKMAVDHDSGII